MTKKPTIPPADKTASPSAPPPPAQGKADVTLRDFFAGQGLIAHVLMAQVLASLVASEKWQGSIELNPELCARGAYDLADAMLAVRAQDAASGAEENDGS